MKSMILIFFILSICFPLVNGHSGGENAVDSTSGVSLTLPQIYAITLICGIILALILYKVNIVRSRRMLYEMLGIAVILLTLDFLVMSKIL